MIIGIVGKPSVGKSTLFKAATLSEVDIANYPFTTIDPNRAVGFVKIPDAAKEFGKKAHPQKGYVKGSWRFVPMDLLDVAGLVPDAHKGEGMGSQFMNDLNQANALVHVIDASGSINEKGEQVPAGSYDPVKDVRFLELELDHWYKGILTRGWEKFTRVMKQEKQDIATAIAKQMSGVGVQEETAEYAIQEAGLQETDAERWGENDLLEISRILRKQTKPTVIAANKCDHKKAEANIKRLQETFPEHSIIPCSAEGELALKEASKNGFIDYIPGEREFKYTKEGETQLDTKQKEALTFLKTTLLDKQESGTGVQKVLNEVVFNTLEQKAIHPGGVSKLEDQHGRVLPDCFLMNKEATALDFAYELHTDFGKNFAKAIDVRTKRPVGKNHVLKHLDIIEIMTN